MRNFFSHVRLTLDTKPKLRTWCWFIFLWLMGLCCTLILSYGTKAVFLLL